MVSIFATCVLLSVSRPLNVNASLSYWSWSSCELRTPASLVSPRGTPLCRSDRNKPSPGRLDASDQALYKSNTVRWIWRNDKNHLVQRFEEPTSQWPRVSGQSCSGRSAAARLHLGPMSRSETRRRREDGSRRWHTRSEGNKRQGVNASSSWGVWSLWSPPETTSAINMYWCTRCRLKHVYCWISAGDRLRS